MDDGFDVCVTEMTFMHYLLCAYLPEVHWRTIDIECVSFVSDMKSMCLGSVVIVVVDNSLTFYVLERYGIINSREI